MATDSRRYYTSEELNLAPINRMNTVRFRPNDKVNDWINEILLKIMSTKLSEKTYKIAATIVVGTIVLLVVMTIFLTFLRMCIIIAHQEEDLERSNQTDSELYDVFPNASTKKKTKEETPSLHRRT